MSTLFERILFMIRTRDIVKTNDSVFASDLEKVFQDYSANCFGSLNQPPTKVWNKMFSHAQKKLDRDDRMMMAAPTMYESMKLTIEVMENLVPAFPDAAANLKTIIDTMKKVQFIIEEDV